MLGRGFFTAIVGVLVLAASVASGAGVLVKIADTSTPIPGGTGNFTSFLAPVSNRGAVPYDPFEIAFRGDGASGQKGVYYYGNDWLFNSYAPFTRAIYSGSAPSQISMG